MKVRLATGLAFLTIAGAGTAADPAASSTETVDAYVSCRIAGPNERAVKFVGRQAVTAFKYTRHWFYTAPVLVIVPRTEFDRAHDAVELQYSYQEELRSNVALSDLYGKIIYEEVGMPFARFMWGDGLGVRPKGQSSPGAWTPGDLSCNIAKDRSHVMSQKYEPLRNAYYVQTDWTMDGPVMLSGADPVPVVRAASGSYSGGSITIEDAAPPVIPAAEMARQRLQGQREEAARMAKAAAEAASYNAEIQAKIAKFFEEAKKRGAAQ